MARDEGEEQEQITIAVPLRRLLTGVSRTQKAPKSIPRIKRYVLRHIDPDWRDAIWDEGSGKHRVWIDDFLNKTIWSRGREHVGGPMEWIEGKDGDRPRLARRTTSRYGSVLKVKALFVEEPRDGGDPRLEVYLYGYGDKEQEEAAKADEEEGEEEGEGEEEEVPAPSSKKAKQAPAEEVEVDEVEEEEKAPVKEEKKPAAKSTDSKAQKPSAAKAEPKKAPAKPKKEGGD